MGGKNMNSILKKHRQAKRKKLHWQRMSVTSEPYHNASEFPYQRISRHELAYHIKNVSKAPQGHNAFQMKTKMLTDMHKPHSKNQSFTVVVTIGGIFLFLTLAITAAVVIFCKKKNSVFALQKSEQSGEYELDEFSDSETGTNDVDNELDSSPVRSKYSSRRSSRRSSRKSLEYSGSVHQPLVLPSACYDSEDSPSQYRKQYAKSSKAANYHKMVVTAVLEKPLPIRPMTSLYGSDDSDCEISKKYLQNDPKRYYQVSTVPSDVDSDVEKGDKLKEDKNCTHVPLAKKYSDDPPSYDSLSLSGKHQVVVNLQNCNCLCHTGCNDYKTNCSLLRSSKKSGKYKPLPLCEGAKANSPDEEKKQQSGGLVVVLPIRENATEISPQKDANVGKRPKKRTSGGVFGINSRGYYYHRPEEHDNDAYAMEPDRFSI